MKLWRASVPVFVIGILISVTACTAQVSKPEPSATPTIASSVQLQCADGFANSGSIVPSLLLTEGVGSALRDTISTLPKAMDVGIWAPTKEWSFRKAPLFLSAGSQVVTLEVPDDGRQYLVWTSADAWTGADESVAARRGWTSSKVVAHGCAEAPTSFYGGLLVQDPTRCFSLTVTRAGQAAVALTISGDGQTRPTAEK
jgi:hypothetical protein